MRTTLLVLTLIGLGCRQDPGEPDYPELDYFVDTGSNNLPGPDPFTGQPRLSVGIFYEGGFTEQVEVDNTTTHFYVYDSTFSVLPTDNRIEGLSSDELTVAGLWFGGGVHWDSPRDLSSWTHMNVSLYSTDSSMDALSLRMSGNTVEGAVSAATYGFVADGEWHSLKIPLGDFTGADLSSVGIAFMFIGEGTSTGHSLLIDNLYFSQE